MPNLSILFHPLNELLKAESKWKWTAACDVAFKEAKKLLTSAVVLLQC